MQRFLHFVRSHMNSWNEICFDDKKRLRLNVILFTFTISIVFFVMSIRTSIMVSPSSAVITLILGIATFALFLWQFFRQAYSPLIAWLFGVMSLAMAFAFVTTGGLEGTGHLWVYVLPIVGTMMVPIIGTFIYNGILIMLLVLLLNSPVYDLIPVEYSAYFRAVFPISVLLVTLCNYVAEYARKRTQKQLQAATEKLRDSAFTDPLTGAYNRRALKAHFGGMEEPAHGLSFAMLDLDYFKKVNDTYGHEAGDKLLCHLVELIHRCIPSGTHLYRWGGEEFLLVLKSSDPSGLAQVLNDICALVAKTPLVLSIAHQDGKPVTLETTVSIGGMCAGTEHNIANSINIADELMYRAKQLGRNRVELDCHGQA
ncbi:GGDEF domain-containing protein [Christensenellaceae bacterium OttesenSCG-928-K19]|nr:GGDEF domain-containing protein [Christensenellaceae bacterium OttesenSCG-928-K19]